jgi:ribonuclease H / adenosylcobalamin/alpha-ribazole phosphatase
VVGRVIVEADGGSRGNPGPAGYGAVVRDADTGAVLAERKGAIGVDTNNVAEYRGLIAGLEAATELGATSVAVRMDSKLVVEQLSGRWQVKHERLRPLAREAAGLSGRFSDVTFEWIPRERNRHADRLANEAMDDAAGRRRTAVPVARSTEAPTATWTPPTGPATRLILVRHATTAANIGHRFSGVTDIPLSDLGERQAKQLADRLAALTGVRLVASSPLRRARQTADDIADRLGRTVQVAEGFTELDFGAWDGLTFDEVVARWPDEFANWSTTPEVAPPGGESLAALTRRVRRARDEIVAMVPDGRVVVVTHVTPIKALLRIALDAPPSALFRFHVDPASVSIIDYFSDGISSVRLVNETSHLDGPAVL